MVGALLLPTCASWLFFDDWLRSPIMLATYIAAVCKFPPSVWGTPLFFWVWPGLM